MGYPAREGHKFRLHTPIAASTARMGRKNLQPSSNPPSLERELGTTLVVRSQGIASLNHVTLFFCAYPANWLGRLPLYADLKALLQPPWI
jgi:hypothetical protein